MKKQRDDDLKVSGAGGVPAGEVAAGPMESDEQEIDGEAVLVKIYDHKDIHRYMDDAESTTLSLKLNDMIEVVGIYVAPVEHTIPPTSTNFSGYDVFSGFEGLDGTDITSKLPALHCVVLRRLGSTYPMYPTLRPGELRNPFLQNLASGARGMSAAHAHAELQRVGSSVADSLGGDLLTANYVTLSIISRVLSRDRGAVVGPLHLNICGVSPTDPRLAALGAVLRNIVPRLVEVLFV